MSRALARVSGGSMVDLAMLLGEATSRAALLPTDVSSVESHGTGTALGDPTEIRALSRVLSRSIITGVKASVGHLETLLDTRFQTFRVQGRYAGVAEEGVVSYGPCQFPTLGFIVERWLAVQAFVPQPFWCAPGLALLSKHFLLSC